MSAPSLSALKTAKTRHQQAMESLHPGSVIISGITIACAVFVGGVEWMPTSGGHARGQRLVCHIRKTLLAEPPAMDVLVRHAGVEFKISETDGRNPGDVAWTLRCIRWLN